MFSIKVLFSERKVPRKLRDRWSFPGANEAWVMEAKSLVSLVATHWAEMQQVAKSAMGLVVDQMPQTKCRRDEESLSLLHVLALFINLVCPMRQHSTAKPFSSERLEFHGCCHRTNSAFWEGSHAVNLCKT